ncbi:nitroreductase family protein [Eubacterium sp. AB3007]|uniref:nitroreductase family protein n=1 Tax=Eubacterium sp. AB3007 TaxID=1392487 RepID=UPI0004844F98|nr:nitroreductase family protein [Eubacterium sp. AB3007]
MSLLELMRTRRSIREFTEEPIPEEVLFKIMEAGVLAPTSKSRMPWEIRVIQDQSLLKTLAKAKWHGARPLENCTAAVAVVADSSVSDVWIEDCSIAMTYMHLMAATQGLGSCWVQLRLRKDADGGDAEQNALAALGYDDPWRLVGILALGIPGEEKPGYGEDDIRKRMEKKIIR